MAPVTESLVIAADVGRTLGEDERRRVVRIAQSIITNKVLYGGKNDAVALLLFGTRETRNDLHDEMVRDGDADQYVDILVLRELSTATNDALAALAGEDVSGSLCSGGRSDHLDALTVAFDILNKDELKSRKKIVLISDFKSEIKEVDEEFRDQVLGGMLDGEINIELVGLTPVTPSSHHPSETKSLVLHLFSTPVASFECAASAPHYAGLREVKTVRPTCTARMELEVGSNFSIPIARYSKIVPATLYNRQKATKYFKDEKNKVYTVGRETEHRKRDHHDDSLVTERVTAFAYGKDLVPLDEVAKGFLAHEENRSMKLLGFKDQDEFPLQLFLSESSVVLPDPGDMGSELAVSALVRGLIEEKKVGIVRFVAKTNSNAQLFALVPVASTDECVPDHFVLSMLPFAEDVREYQFASLNASDKWIPSDEELGLAGKIVEGMTFGADTEAGGSGGEEGTSGFSSHKIPNPQVLNLNAFLVEKLSGAPAGTWQQQAKDHLSGLMGPSKEALGRVGPDLERMAALMNVKKAKAKPEVKKENGGQPEERVRNTSFHQTQQR